MPTSFQTAEPNPLLSQRPSAPDDGERPTSTSSDHALQNMMPRRDVAHLMNEVRQSVRSERAPNDALLSSEGANVRRALSRADSSFSDDVSTTEWRHFHLHLDNGFAHSVMGSTLPELKDCRPFKRRLFRFAARCICFLARFISKRQTQFNVSTLEMLRELQTNVRMLDQVQHDTAQRLRSFFNEENSQRTEFQNALPRIHARLAGHEREFQKQHAAQNQWRDRIAGIEASLQSLHDTMDKLACEVNDARSGFHDIDFLKYESEFVETCSRLTSAERNIRQLKDALMEHHSQFRHWEDQWSIHQRECEAERTDQEQSLENRLEGARCEWQQHLADEISAWNHGRIQDRTSLEESWTERLAPLEQVVAALKAEWDQRILGQWEALQKSLAIQRSELQRQETRLGWFLEEARRRLPEPFSPHQLQIFADEDRRIKDGFYAAFEDRFRGCRQEIKDRLRVYLPRVEMSVPIRENGLILDIGCGRGEWLELLQEAGFSPRGVDINHAFVEQCRARGLDVIEGDGITYLAELPNESVSAVTGFHIAEHLPFESLLRLIDETVRVLKPGGLVILESPNPENLLVGACNFYCDPTHLRPLYPPTLQFLVEQKGLVKVEILRLDSQPHQDRFQLLPDDHPLAASLNPYLQILKQSFAIGPDFAIIGQKVS